MEEIKILKKILTILQDQYGWIFGDKKKYYIFFSANYRRLPFWFDTKYFSDNGAFNCKLATGNGATPIRSEKKTSERTKKLRPRGICIWSIATRRNKVLELIISVTFLPSTRTWQNGGSGERDINQREKCLLACLTSIPSAVSRFFSE